MDNKSKDALSYIEAKNVEIKELPKMTVAYIRYTGPYKGDSKLFENLYNKLFKWVGAHSLLNLPETKSLVIYHDNPEITDEKKFRVSVCITVPENTEVTGEIGKIDIPRGKYSLSRYEIEATEFYKAWNWVYGIWFPDSGYQPDNRPCFELYQNDPEDYPENKIIFDICAPVKPL